MNTNFNFYDSELLKFIRLDQVNDLIDRAGKAKPSDSFQVVLRSDGIDAHYYKLEDNSFISTRVDVSPALLSRCIKRALVEFINHVDCVKPLELWVESERLTFRLGEITGAYDALKRKTSEAWEASHANQKANEWNFPFDVFRSDEFKLADSLSNEVKGIHKAIIRLMRRVSK